MNANKVYFSPQVHNTEQDAMDHKGRWATRVIQGLEMAAFPMTMGHHPIPVFDKISEIKWVLNVPTEWVHSVQVAMKSIPTTGPDTFKRRPGRLI